MYPRCNKRVNQIVIRHTTKCILKMIFHKRNFFMMTLGIFIYSTHRKLMASSFLDSMGFIVMHGKLFFPFVNGSKPRINVVGPPHHNALLHNKACSKPLYDNLIHTFVVLYSPSHNSTKPEFGLLPTHTRRKTRAVT